MDVGTRGGRRQSKRFTNNVQVNEDKNKDGLSQQHVIRLEEELVKFPNPSVYYKKKIAARLTKEFNVPERIIINWLNENGKRDMSKQRTVTPTLVQSKQDFTEIKKEIIEQPKPSIPKADDDIQCIDIDTDEDDDVLLSDADQNDSVSLSEKPALVKVKPSSTSSPHLKTSEVDNLKETITNLEKELRDRDNSKQFKEKYEKLLGDYQEKVELEKNFKKIHENMIKEFKDYVYEMEAKHKKTLSEKENDLKNLKDDSSKTLESIKKIKALEAKNAESTKMLDGLETKLKVSEEKFEKSRKEYEEYKENQENMNNKYRKLIQKQETELDQHEKDGQELKNKIKKMKEDFSKKNPQQMKELCEVKEAKKKLKKELELKDKEVCKIKKDYDEKLSKLESEKKSANKKISRLEEENVMKTNSNDDYKKLNEELSVKLKVITKDLKESQSAQGNEKSKFENELKKLQAELKNVKAEFLTKEEKILETSLKRGDKIKELEVQETENLKKINDIDEELLEMKQKLKSLESEKNLLAKDLEDKKKEASNNKSIILECKAEIENAKTLIRSSTKDISERNTAISDLKKKLELSEASSISKQTEIEDMKAQLAKKEVDTGKFKEISEKVKEKEYSLLKLRNIVFEKDATISSKDLEIKNLSARITEIKKDFDKKMENRAFEEINNQNNLRHQLLLQQQEMRKSLLADQELLKQQLLQQSQELQNGLLETMENEAVQHLKKQTELQDKIKEKKDLLKKVKQALLYRPSEHQGVEKSSHSSRAKLQLSYNWPMLHVSGHPLDAEETSTIFVGSEVLNEMLQIRSGTMCWTLEPAAVRGCKRKFEEDTDFFSKRQKREVPVLMIGYSWPLVLHEKPKSWTVSVNFDVKQSTSLLASIPILIENMKLKASNKRKLEEENVRKSVRNKRFKADPIPMLNYSWPLVVYQNKKIPTLICSFNFTTTPLCHLSITDQVEAKPSLLMLTWDKPIQAPYSLNGLESSSLPSPTQDLLLNSTHDESKTSSKRSSEDTEESYSASKKFKTFISIPSYRYKIVSSSSTKCTRSPGLCSPRKVKARSYKVPSFHKTSSKKRSFLDFLEGLSSEEMQDIDTTTDDDDEGLEYVLNSPVIITKPRAKRQKCLLTLQTLAHSIPVNVTRRQMSENLQKEEDFISSSEMLLNVTSSIVDSILLDIF